MPSASRKHRGYRTERVVAAYLSQWWPGASVGRGAGKDIVNIPMDLEVKARGDFSPKSWMNQVKRRTEKTGELSLVCVRLNGQGESPENYLAFLTLKDLVHLLLKAGYGQFQSDSVNLVPTRCNQCGSWMIEGATCPACQKANNADL